MYNTGAVSGWVEMYLFASLSDDVIGSTLLYMIVLLGVRQLLEEQKKFKKNEELYEAKIKKIDSFYSDLKKGLDEVMSKVKEVGKMWVCFKWKFNFENYFENISVTTRAFHPALHPLKSIKVNF